MSKEKLSEARIAARVSRSINELLDQIEQQTGGDRVGAMARTVGPLLDNVSALVAVGLGKGDDWGLNFARQLRGAVLELLRKIETESEK